MTMPWDFSKPETKAVFRHEVEKRITEFGLTREQAELLVAALMTETKDDHGLMPPRQQ
jgi:hypothetical protein